MFASKLLSANRPKITTCLSKRTSKRHFDDTCDPKWPVSISACQSTRSTHGGYTVAYHALMLTRRKIAMT